MDLLDDIEDYSSTQFQKQDVLEATQPQEQQQGEDDEQPTQNLLGFDFGALSKVLQGDEEEGEGEGDAPNLSILDRVSKRLNGGGNDDTAEVEDTQKIDDAPTKTGFQLLPQLEVDETEYGTQVVAPTQMIAATRVIDKTQVIAKPRVIDQTQVIAKPHIAQTQVISKPQLDQTQVIPKPTTTIDSLFVSEDESEEEPANAPLSKEERGARIAQLVEQKRLERLAKEREELEQDITKGTITDEEEELNQEANDSVVSSHIVKDGLSTKELEKAQEFLNIQKRHVDIRPEFEKKVVFTKDRLLSAFSDDDEEEEESTPKTAERPPSSPTVEEILRSSPFTSPVKEQEESIMDLFQKPASKPKNPLGLYAEKLKQQLSSSPTTTNGNGKNLINLDSDSDIDIVSSSPTKHRSTNINTHQSKFSNRAKELDKIPELTKEQRLMIKQKFSKKKYQNSKNNMSSNPQQQQKESDFFKKLHKKNIDQLKLNKMNDPDHAILEELEQDEQTMTSLLEREMERVRNIRRKEKLQERAKEALLGKALGQEQSDDGDYHEDVPDSDVADSEVPDSDYESGTERDEGEDEEEEEELGAVRIDDNFRSDDSYMFGGGEMDNEDRDHRITTTMDDDKHCQQQQQPRPSSEYDDLSFANQSTELFQNLQPRSKNEESFISTQDESSLMQINPPLFDDLPGLPTQMQVDAIATQRDDEPTQRDENPTQKDDVATQKIPSRKTKDTQVILPPIKQEESEDDEEDDDLVTPANVQRGRKQVRNSMLKIEEEDEENSEEDVQDEDESPEAIQRRIKEYEMKIRKRELKLRKRRKEMERHGLKNVIEGEAEESEDEWKGLGGIDGEVSDVANSEDEKMIDNNFNIDLKNEEIRKKFMEDYQIEDQKELEKLLDDIKNHKLIKRAGVSNGLDIEISDEEDGVLEAYRRQKLIEQQQRLLKNKKLVEIFKNEKSKAFFNSIKDDIEIIKIDDSDSDDDDEIQILGESKKEKLKSDTEKDEAEHEDSLEKEAPVKKTIKIDESFVKKKLSFLYTTNDDDEYERVQRMSRLQHGYVDEDDDVEDVKALKSKSILNLTSTSTSKAPAPVDSMTEQLSKKRTHVEAGDTDVDDDDDIAEFIPSFKKPSVVGSFRSFQEQQGITIKDGKHHFSGVTISKQYKVVSGSKASITFMSKNSKRQVKSLKEKKIEKTIDLSKRKNNGFFDNSGFD
ncbi:Mediator of replication checkpoint protein 1 [Candida viswanathii]|uniref:Mediator of replication checkpoint protein 1 n=1 Tax=Candida viswanathii TaxID=5486 RepID=A0A367XSI0_9ASCO|nr:Mediator of replication checkpoint protein 1 [Candida viswanathii]